MNISIEELNRVKEEIFNNIENKDDILKEINDEVQRLVNDINIIKNEEEIDE